MTKHWLLERLEYLRKEARGINFSSGTTRRRRELLEILKVIIDPRSESPWGYAYQLTFTDNGTIGKIIMIPRHVFNKKDGRIILEYPHFHNTHRQIFIFFETTAGMKIAESLRQKLCEETMAFEFPLILKEGQKFTVIDPT